MEWDMFGIGFCALKPNPYLVHLSFIPTNDLNHKMPIKSSSGASSFFFFLKKKSHPLPPFFLSGYLRGISDAEAMLQHV